MSWREAWLRYNGLLQSNDAIAKAAYLIHCSLVDKESRVNIHEYFYLPFTQAGVEREHESTLERLLKKREQIFGK